MHHIAQSPNAARRILGWMITGLVLIAVALSIGLLFGRGSTAATANSRLRERGRALLSPRRRRPPPTSPRRPRPPPTSPRRRRPRTPVRAPPTRQVPHRRRAPPTPQAPPSQVRIWVCPRRSPARPATASG